MSNSKCNEYICEVSETTDMWIYVILVDFFLGEEDDIASTTI